MSCFLSGLNDEICLPVQIFLPRWGVYPTRQEGDSLKVVSIGEGETKTNIDGGPLHGTIWISIQLDRGSFTGAQVELLLKWPKWWNPPTHSDHLAKMRSILPSVARRWPAQSSLNWRRWFSQRSYNPFKNSSSCILFFRQCWMALLNGIILNIYKTVGPIEVTRHLIFFLSPADFSFLSLSLSLSHPVILFSSSSSSLFLSFFLSSFLFLLCHALFFFSFFFFLFLSCTLSSSSFLASFSLARSLLLLSFFFCHLSANDSLQFSNLVRWVVLWVLYFVNYFEFLLQICVLVCLDRKENRRPNPLLGLVTQRGWEGEEEGERELAMANWNAWEFLSP